MYVLKELPAMTRREQYNSPVKMELLEQGKIPKLGWMIHVFRYNPWHPDDNESHRGIVIGVTVDDAGLILKLITEKRTILWLFVDRDRDTITRGNLVSPQPERIQRCEA